MKKYSSLKIFTATIALFLTLFFGPALQAASPTSIVNTNDGKYDTGSYELNDGVILAVRISQIILGIVGSLTLLMFIYGGFTFLTSGGSSEKVSKGKNIIIAAVIGLIIVFSSYLIIKFTIEKLTVYTPNAGLQVNVNN